MATLIDYLEKKNIKTHKIKQIIKMLDFDNTYVVKKEYKKIIKEFLNDNISSMDDTSVSYFQWKFKLLN